MLSSDFIKKIHKFPKDTLPKTEANYLGLNLKLSQNIAHLSKLHKLRNLTLKLNINCN